MKSAQIKERARQAGFSVAGIAPVEASPELLHYPEWLKAGYAGTMEYLKKHQAARMDPGLLLEDARSVIVCAVNYNTAPPRTSYDALRAWISRYAWGLDYHDTIKARLREFAEWIQTHAGCRTRTFVDTGPVNERVFAKYAGLGWFGKNTCIINEKIGSWLFLGCILSDAVFDYDVPAPDRCGTCTRCLDACPTGAFVAPYTLDSRKCISYQTIELRGDIPESDRPGIGHHLFGCDICQDVCPWNRRAPASTAAEFQPKPELLWPEIEKLLELDEAQWMQLIRGTALRRAKVRGLIRNLMVVAGNSGISAFVPALRRFLQHEDETIRRHASWAIHKLTDRHEAG